MLQTKIYVLLDSLDNNAPIYQQIGGGKRIQLKKRPTYPIFNQVTFMDEDGKNKTIRYRNDVESIYQDEQIKQGVLANERYTTQDRTDLIFRNGVLATNKPLHIKYLDAFPGNENFKGICNAVPAPFYKELDEVKDTRMKNSDFRKRVEAANKLLEISEDLEAQNTLLIRLNGSFFQAAPDAEKAFELLQDYLDEADEAGLDLILKDDSSLNIDEETVILLGKLLNANKLSFTKEEGAVSKLSKDGKWINIREISAETLEEKKRLFSAFLNTDSGKALKADLESDLKSKVKEVKEGETKASNKK